MKGFGIVEGSNNKSRDAPSFDMEMAISLFNELSSRNITKVRSSQTISKWSNEFKRLRKVASKSEISALMEWWRENCQDEDLPRISSALAFRREYWNLKKIFLARKGVLLPSSPISEEVKQISKRMNLCWPGDEKKYELQFLQANYSFIKNFRRRLAILQKQLEHQEGQSKMLSIVTRLLNVMSGPQEFTEGWASEVNDMSWNWNGWRRDLLLNYVLHDHHSRFVQHVSRIIADYCSSGHLVDNLMALLKDIK